MPKRFSQSSHQVLATAQREAELRETKVGPEYILLALLRSEHLLPLEVRELLLNHEVTLEAFHEGLLPPATTVLEPAMANVPVLRSAFPPPIPDPRGDIPNRSFVSSRPAQLALQSKNLLTFAAVEAQRLGRVEIAPEHFLLALLRLHRSPSAHWLKQRGLSVLLLRQILAQGAREIVPWWSVLTPQNIARAFRSPDARKNIICFAIPVFCWLPLPFVGPADKSLAFRAIIGLFALPFFGAIVAAVLLLLSQSRRLKNMALSFCGGIIAALLYALLLFQLR